MRSRGGLAFVRLLLDEIAEWLCGHPDSIIDTSVNNRALPFRGATHCDARDSVRHLACCRPWPCGTQQAARENEKKDSLQSDRTSVNWQFSTSETVTCEALTIDFRVLDKWSRPSIL